MTRITYEITAVVENDLITEYEEFMTERHIPDLMATGAFASATLSRSSAGRYRIRYEARSREALDEYLANHAQRLRNHLAGAFPAGIEFTREEWEVLAAFESAE
jgi:hypothetical protein